MAEPDGEDHVEFARLDGRDEIPRVDEDGHGADGGERRLAEFVHRTHPTPLQIGRREDRPVAGREQGHACDMEPRQRLDAQAIQPLLDEPGRVRGREAAHVIERREVVRNQGEVEFRHLARPEKGRHARRFDRAVLHRLGKLGRWHRLARLGHHVHDDLTVRALPDVVGEGVQRQRDLVVERRRVVNAHHDRFGGRRARARENHDRHRGSDTPSAPRPFGRSCAHDSCREGLALRDASSHGPPGSS